MSSQPAPAHYSLYRLQQHLQRVVALNMRQPVWVRAEISSINIQQHAYISLVGHDPGERARADAIIWGKDLRRLRSKLGDMWDAILRPGRQVLFLVQPELHEYYGLKLTVSDVFEQFTIGHIEMERRRTAQWLQEQGLWERNRRLPLPALVQRIAVVSSPEAAGLQDFMRHLQDNDYGYAYHCRLFPAAVQGSGALHDIPERLRDIADQADRFDCVVIVRGGGAKLDLLEFDRREICAAIAQCPLPVLTGIGHDIDLSLADQVAHTALKTPTAVAHFCIDRHLQAQAHAEQCVERIERHIALQCRREQQRLLDLERRLAASTNKRLLEEQLKLERIEQRLQASNPHLPLAKGYALAFDDQGQPIRSATHWQQARGRRLRFADGEVLIPD